MFDLNISLRVMIFPKVISKSLRPLMGKRSNSSYIIRFIKTIIF